MQNVDGAPIGLDGALSFTELLGQKRGMKIRQGETRFLKMTQKTDLTILFVIVAEFINWLTP